MTTRNATYRGPDVRARCRRRAVAVTGLALVALVLTGVLVFRGVLWPNRLFASGYEVRGVDVSHYQGTIDWPTLAAQDLDFAWIKATEGSSHTDPRFDANWQGASRTDLLVGAYHFLSFESPGEDQLANLTTHVPRTPGSLPPVVDLEPYGEFVGHLPSADTVHAILDPLLAGIEEHYGVHPILYVTKDAYDAYVAGRYPDSPIWIRSVTTPPRLSDGRDWTVWQYSHRDRLPGYDGVETYIDLNVFAGSPEDLAALTVP